MPIVASEKDLGVFRFLSPVCGHLKKSWWQMIPFSFLTRSRWQCIHAQGWTADHLIPCSASLWLRWAFDSVAGGGGGGRGGEGMGGDARAPWFFGQSLMI